MNLIQLINRRRADDEFSRNNFGFIVVKEFYFLNIILNANFFSDLKFEYYCEYFPVILLQVSLKEETKLDGRSHEIFSGKITGP